MSVVSGIVLCCSCCEEFGSKGEDGPPLLFEQINAWMADRRPYWSMTLGLEEQFVGGKHPQMFVAGAGLNHFPEDEFSDFVLSLPWQCPDNIVLIIQPEDGPTHVVRPSELKVIA